MLAWSYKRRFDLLNTMGVTVKKSGPGLAPLALSLEQLRHAEVLVGIPQSTTQRQNEPLNNASLMYILTHGSPLRNIPATPILEPSIELNKKLITPHLEAAAKATIDKDPTRAQQELELAGVVAANGAKRYFTDPTNGWPPNKPSTIARKGSDRRNIDTGALRRSVTWVVRNRP